MIQNTPSSIHITFNTNVYMPFDMCQEMPFDMCQEINKQMADLKQDNRRISKVPKYTKLDKPGSNLIHEISDTNTKKPVEEDSMSITTDLSELQ